MPQPAIHSLSLFAIASCLLLLAACNESEEPDGEQLSYYADAKDILDARCANCHQDGAIAPFSLSTYEEAHEYQSVLAHSIVEGTMPPWMPDNTCNQYQHDRSLSEDERDILLGWVADGAPEGQATGGQDDDDQDSEMSFDFAVTMAEAYTPQLQPDDYRCFLVDWAAEETEFVTAFKVNPGSPETVHHVIAFVVNPNGADTFRAMDAADDGPGYTCFGSPAAGPASVATNTYWRWLGSWAPGGGARALPAGTGISVEPGSLIVMQVHYNTLVAEPVSDITSIDVQLSDSVDKPAVVMPLTDYRWLSGNQPMSIPAGSTDTIHSVSMDLSDTVLGYIGAPAGLSPGDSFQLHSIGLHMHTLGTRGRIWLERGEDDEQCLLDIPRWDFNWQGAYDLVEPVTVHPGDVFNLECQWDNSAANQIVVDGEQLPPQDIQWGDGTRDEMCLAIAYATAL